MLRVVPLLARSTELANQPGDSATDRTMSVYADSLPMNYGDPARSGCREAAFKLVVRIVDEQLNAHEITAIAAYRQGVESVAAVDVRYSHGRGIEGHSETEELGRGASRS